jgi:hypothetical protein
MGAPHNPLFAKLLARRGWGKGNCIAGLRIGEALANPALSQRTGANKSEKSPLLLPLLHLKNNIIAL